MGNVEYGGMALLLGREGEHPHLNLPPSRGKRFREALFLRGGGARLAVYNAASLGFADWSILIGGIHWEARD